VGSSPTRPTGLPCAKRAVFFSNTPHNLVDKYQKRQAYMSANLYIPESAMAISAHPDDNEFTCVGTLARWAKAGTRVIYVLCTSGDVGID
jgi:hypothetical protein